MALPVGTRLGPYEIVSFVAAGGMGEVYCARDTRLARSVAIKVLPASFASDPDRLRRFEQEARAVAALNHPNILALHDIGSQDGISYLVSEFLEGNTLREQLGNGPLPARKAIEYALQIARGLGAAHDKGIVHRDLKPENIFVTEDGRLKILDFGLAKVQTQATLDGETAASQTMPGVVLGTAGYMSPEQVRGQSIDHRSDIFSFGAVLYEMLSGNRAFKGDTSVETMSAILREDPPELTRAAPPVHPTVERPIRHCLEKNPIERFRSAHDLAFQLELAAEGLFPKAEMAVTHSSAFRLRLVLPLVLVLLLVALPLVFLIGRLSARPEPPAYKRLTFRTGSVSAARFSSDGRTIVYAAAWEGNPSEIFVSRVDSSEARPLGIGPSELLSVSKNGELAVLLKPEFGPWRASGTLASVSLEGGTPREIAEDVTAADWAPDGSGLAIVRKSDRLEFPIGKVLFQSAGWLDHPRFSPDGKSIAFFEHPSSGGNGGSLVTCDLIGTIKIIATGLDTALSLAWSPNGKEVWFSGVRGPGAVAILAISREGKERLVARDTGWMTVHDVARDGRVLLTRDDWRVGVKALAPHSTEERELSWFEWSLMGAISPDGEMIAFSESAEAVAGKGYAYVRSIRGTPAVRLGEGRPTSISPDKKWVAVTTETVPPQLVLLPTGSGEPKRFPSITGHIFYPQFLADGKRIAFGVAAGSTDRLYSMVLDTGEVKPALPESVIGFTFSPDGKSVVASGASDLADKIYDLSGGPPRPIRGLNKGESVEAWGNDPLPLYVSAREGSAVNLYRLDPVSGNRQLWRRLMPSDPAGVRLVADIYIAPDAQAYGYSYYRFLSQLCMGEGLR
jgi:serine/threonine protein kinase/dipeptidyl aminopeptidase/acylaminoacyl peptidase